MQVIIHGKCKIRLSTAKIQDRKFSSLIQFRKDIFDKFQKTVDLTELIGFCTHNLSILRHNSKILKKRHRDSLFQHVLFLTVMAHINLLFPAFFYLTFYGHFSFFTYKNCIIRSLCLHLHLAHISHIFEKYFTSFFLLHILVKCLIVPERFKLKVKDLFFQYRSYLYLLYIVFLLRITQRC